MLRVWVNYPEDEERIVGETKTIFRLCGLECLRY